MRQFVTILTDFGDLDPYVGVMKGVIAGIAPEARTVDLTHNIPPGDIAAAAYALLQVLPFYPHGTIHLVVVDPGVGSRRRPIAASVGPATVVGPDNGVFTYLYAQYGRAKVVELVEPRFRLLPISNTFHGRDIFAPAAAHLAQGVALSAFGPVVTDPVEIPLPRMEEAGPGQLRGEVLHADRFGNLATSIAWLNWVESGALELEPWLPGRATPRRFDAAQARVILRSSGGARTLIGIHRTFSDVAYNQPAVIVGSERHLDIVVNRGSAAEQLSLKPGDEVLLEFPVARRGQGE
jgi:S-adenosylmethionine hydrolase